MIRRKPALDGGDGHTLPDDSQHALNKRIRTGQKKVLLAVVLFLGLGWGIYHFSDLKLSAIHSTLPVTTSSTVQTTASTTIMPINRPDYSKDFGDCSLSFQPPEPRSKWTTKPAWLPGYPATLGAYEKPGDDLARPLVAKLTGMAQGAKNYHAQSKKLRRCKGATETVTCSQIHPVVPIHPEKLVDDFSPQVIFTIRNFMSAFPTSHSFKANKYHNVEGQVAQDEWRSVRDGWVEKSFESWKDVILTWKKMNYYKIGMYLPYEHLIDRVKGPETIRRLGKLFGDMGFPVAPESDMACIWYQVTQPVVDFEKDYYKYKPGYTAKQRDFMIQAMQTFIDEMTEAGDQELVSILKEYKEEIRDGTRID